jgi:hypothetical protein
MDSKAMPQIMEPGLVTRAVTAAPPGIRTQTAEVLFDDVARHGSAATQAEERCTRTLRVPGCLSLREGLCHPLLEVSPQRDEPRFMTLRVAHGEQGVG